MNFIIPVLIALTLSPLVPSSTIHYENESQEPTHEIVQAEVSAYTSSEGETDENPFETASGATVSSGTLACPTRIQFGTRVEIEGKIYTCEDRMNKRYRETEHYDIWMADKKLAYEWGRKSLTIKVYQD